jgi:hypothetical protein
VHDGARFPVIEPHESFRIMTHSIQRETIVETLLNTLEAERYVRGALLATIIDELSKDEELAMAAEAARSILAALRAGQLESEPPSAFAIRVGALRQLVQGLTAPPESGEVLIREARNVLAHAFPRTEESAAAASAA